MIAARKDRSAVPASPVAPPEDRRSPFIRLADLLAGIDPGRQPLSAAVGEPQHAMPAFVGPVLAQALPGFGRYPRAEGTPTFRAAAARWLAQRYALARPIDADREVLALNGSREGLFSAAIVARRLTDPKKGAKGRPAMLLPNPFYAAYAAGAEAAGCEAVVVPTSRDSGWLPDLDALDKDLLDRTVALYIASPANPQGSIASAAYLGRALELARRHGAFLFSDECYSEIYLGAEKPAGILEVAGGDFSRAVAFNSLSKRSSLPGLRCGFCAGDPAFLKDFLAFRWVAAPQVPEPLQAVAVAALEDEVHVTASRDLYRAKFDLADRLLEGRLGYERPGGGFFLWLDVSHLASDTLSGGEAAAVKLWREQGLRTVPGGYLARRDLTGANPAADFLRVALVQDLPTCEEVLTRLVAALT
ncbi:aminotransferase class I/II-fold pyridoxal phosphate-dependent enzyme [Xanthobacter autotrophicus]|uniref:aminotransferase class I/II-fold pyridoxal phosphate-dependent enzyme n=1 Tax=Xanthobacter autotrophicus TaxID=280 RepID=UPI0024A6CDCF|nr:aminotransferase class I/II-fold pyridoxal phosphate-dependent enzyme [Xanthobacter autotrophicus]MDI4656494.1 aminotransferase class I/II-fold pyridoxal phosphate-dependent enzyme [Xanthobacter autotrophicus]